MKLLLGVDAGGSFTRAALASSTGLLLGVGQGEPGNPHDVGLERACRNVARAVEAAFRRARRRRAPVAACAVGLAGVAEEAELRAIRRALARHRLARTLSVCSDLAVAHAAAFAGGPGIVVVAGTGSCAWGRTRSGRSARAGGLGGWLDDPGSAFDLARRAMVAAVRAQDGRGAPTVLARELPAALGLASVRRMAVRVQQGAIPRARIAACAPRVLEAAARGDRVARAIVAEACGELALGVAAVARRLRWRDPAVVVRGGVAGVPSYARALETALARVLPGARLELPALTALEGALLLATQALKPGGGRGSRAQRTGPGRNRRPNASSAPAEAGQ